MSPAFLITGTDTEIGKTFVTCALLYAAKAKGWSAAGLKPIAAGVDETGENEDVARIRAANSVCLPDDVLNPYCFEPAIAPHIAAAEAKVTIDFSTIALTVARARSISDLVLVEGVGGFCVPLGEEQDSRDLAKYLALPVVLVVGLRLGCLNHALLTAEMIRASGLELAGWIANELSPEMPRLEENVATLSRELKRRHGCELLGQLPFSPDEHAASAACAVQIEKLTRLQHPSNFT